MSSTALQRSEFLLSRQFCSLVFLVFFSSAALALSGPATIDTVFSSNPAENSKEIVLTYGTTSRASAGYPLAKVYPTGSSDFELLETNPSGQGVLKSGTVLMVGINTPASGGKMARQELILELSDSYFPFKVYVPEASVSEEDYFRLYVAPDGSTYFQKDVSTGELLTYTEAVSRDAQLARPSSEKAFREAAGNFELTDFSLFYGKKGGILPMYTSVDIDLEQRVSRLTDKTTGSYADFYYDNVYVSSLGTVNRLYVRSVNKETGKVVARAGLLEVPEKKSVRLSPLLPLNITVYPTSKFMVEVMGKRILYMVATNNTDAEETTMVLARLVDGEGGGEMVRLQRIVWDTKNLQVVQEAGSAEEASSVEGLPLKRITKEDVWQYEYSGDIMSGLNQKLLNSSPDTSTVYEYSSLSDSEPSKINGFEFARTDLGGGEHEIEGPDYYYLYGEDGSLEEIMDKATTGRIPTMRKTDFIPLKKFDFSDEEAVSQNSAFFQSACENPCTVSRLLDADGFGAPHFQIAPYISNEQTDLYSARWASVCGNEDNFFHDNARDADGRIEYVCCAKIRMLKFDSLSGFYPDIYERTIHVEPEFIYSSDYGAWLETSSGCLMPHTEDINPNMPTPEQVCSRLKNSFAQRKCMESLFMDVFGKTPEQQRAVVALQAAFPIGKLILAMAPVTGTLVDIYDAFADPTPTNIAFASISFFPVIGAFGHGVSLQTIQDSSRMVVRALHEIGVDVRKVPFSDMLRPLMEQKIVDLVHNDLFREGLDFGEGKAFSDALDSGRMFAYLMKEGGGRPGMRIRAMAPHFDSIFEGAASTSFIDSARTLRLGTDNVGFRNIADQGLTLGELRRIAGWQEIPAQAGIAKPGSRLVLEGHFEGSAEYGYDVMRGLSNESLMGPTRRSADYNPNIGREIFDTGFDLVYLDRSEGTMNYVKDAVVTREMWSGSQADDWVIVNMRMYAPDQGTFLGQLDSYSQAQVFRTGRSLQQDVIFGLTNKSNHGVIDIFG